MRGRGKRAYRNRLKIIILSLCALTCNFLASRGIPALAPEKVELMKIGDRQITFWNRRDHEYAGKAIDPTEGTGLRDRAMLELLFSTGLTRIRINFAEYNQIKFRARGNGGFGPRGKRENELSFISDDAAGLVIKNISWLAVKPPVPLFRNPKTGKRLSVRTVERVVHKFALKAECVKKFHHTPFATRLRPICSLTVPISAVSSRGWGTLPLPPPRFTTHLPINGLEKYTRLFHSRSQERRNSKPRPKTLKSKL